jgi:hypothetical protein
MVKCAFSASVSKAPLSFILCIIRPYHYSVSMSESPLHFPFVNSFCLIFDFLNLRLLFEFSLLYWVNFILNNCKVKFFPSKIHSTDFLHFLQKWIVFALL